MDNTTIFLVICVATILGFVLVLAVRNTIIFKMAFRNFSRRKAHTALVIGGLMVGTAIISGSLIVQDTLVYIFEEDVYNGWGTIDEVIYGRDQVGNYIYFNESVYQSLDENLTGNDYIDGVSPMIIEIVAVKDVTQLQAEPNVRLIGIDGQKERKTGFGALDGEGFFTDSLGENGTALDKKLAEELNAEIGDELQITFGTPNATDPFNPMIVSETLFVEKIIEDDGPISANFRNGMNIFVELDKVQEIFGKEGKINYIKISNAGDAYDGYLDTEEVNETIRSLLDDITGMSDLGLYFIEGNNTFSMTTYDEPPFFPQSYVDIAEEEVLEANANAKVLTTLSVPVLAADNIPLRNTIILGLNGTVANFTIPAIDEGTILVFYNTSLSFNISTNDTLMITSMALDGSLRYTNFTVAVLPPGSEQSVPAIPGIQYMGFVNLSESQAMLSVEGMKEDSVSMVIFSNLTQNDMTAIPSQIRSRIDQETNSTKIGIEERDVKFDGLGDARNAGEMIGEIFMIFGMFSIIAGIMLVVNIFVMLGQERKPESGMARAVGMKRRQLTQMFLFEGTSFSLLSSGLGAFMGLGVAYFIVWSFGKIFGTVVDGLIIPFYFRWESILIAFCVGLIITFFTILVTSWSISGLNIVRAIRNIPEPTKLRAEKRTVLLGLLGVAAGILLFVNAVRGDDSAVIAAAPCVSLLGLSLVLRLFTSQRVAYTTAGIGMVAWILNPYDFFPDADFSGFKVFVFSGIFLVLGGILIVMFNSNLLLRFLEGISKATRSSIAVLKIAISYPMNKKFRTGMTLAMFSLIIFMVTVVAMMTSMQESTTADVYEEQSGGYDIIGVTNEYTPVRNLTADNLPESLSGYEFEKITSIAAATVNLETERDFGHGGVPSYFGEDSSRYMVLGVDDGFLDTNEFTLKEMDINYSSPREVYSAMEQNSSLVVVDGTALVGAVTYGPYAAEGVTVGNEIVISDIFQRNRTRTLKVIGIMDQNYFFQAIFMQKDVVVREYSGAEILYLFDMKDGTSDADIGQAAEDIESEFIDYGMETTVIKETIEKVLNITSSIMNLMQSFLGLGLLVGIAGLGVITIRSVNERKQEIGMMRAIGFKRQMILKSFLIETSFIAIMGIALGVILGIALSHQIYTMMFKDMGASFIIPWWDILEITALSYGATLLCTIQPALAASRISPAEALRYLG